MEKRRRARINNCLDELKSLILDAMKKDPARHSKLEKADILEMTVKHLQEIQREQMRNAVASDPSVLAKFHNGFTECATEVSRYITCLDGVDEGVRRRLVGHLTGCVTGLSQVLPLATTTTDPSTGSNVNVSSAEDVNNNRGGDRSSSNSGANTGGLRLVPSRLPSGELAILLPGMEEHKSAFKAVVGGKTTPPPPSPISPSIPPSPLHSLHSASSDLITSTTPEPHTELAETNTDQKTIASTSEPQNNPEMWRPW